MFSEYGFHVLVDGQYGSTGKGLVARYLAEQAEKKGVPFRAAITNAGPNSGHTSYDKDGLKHVLKQLPTFAVSTDAEAHLSAGAVIDPAILLDEANRYPDTKIIVHPNAAVISPEDKEYELGGYIAMAAGTRSGTGAALMRKIARDPTAILGLVNTKIRNVTVVKYHYEPWHNRYFVEVPQGFSLGINQRFYPKCTSRECTVSQAMADIGAAPYYVAKVYMVVRTFPIRVGNIEGYTSGDWYPDQFETSWEKLGIEPELTTNTKRVRRIATFSWQQFKDAVEANCPDFVFFNFMNYLKTEEEGKFVDQIRKFKHWHKGKPFVALLGYGPKSSDICYMTGENR